MDDWVVPVDELTKSYGDDARLANDWTHFRFARRVSSGQTGHRVVPPMSPTL